MARRRFGMALLLALACDEDAVNTLPPLAPPEGTPDAAAPEGAAGQGPVGAGDDAGVSGSAGGPSTGATDERQRLGAIEPADILGARVLQMLESECQSCHDGSRPDAFGAITDIPGLVESGRVLPGSAVTSPLFLAFQSGHMQRPNERFTVGNVEVVARFIDGLRSEAACEALPFVGTEEVFEAVRRDLDAQPEDARRFARYASLTYASNAGECGTALERQRLALFQALNATSLAEQIVLPQAIDERQLVYRLDLRDYRYDRALDLEDDGTTDHADGWLAAARAAGAYAGAWRGPQVDAAAAAAGTAVPLLPAHVLVHAIAAGDLYYALVDVRRDIELDRELRGVVLADDRRPVTPAPTPQKWVAFFQAIGRSDVIAIRAEQPLAPGAYWWIEDELRVDAESVVDKPFELNSSPRQVQFDLPNGLRAFAIEADGQRQTTVLSHGASEFQGSAPVSLAACSACHSLGLLPLKDQLRELAQNESITRDWFSPGVAEVLEYYATPEELDDLIAADDARHRAALDRVGIPANEPDPLSWVYHQFEREPLTAPRAAAELGVPLAAFAAALPRLDARLAVLAQGGSIDRGLFTAVLPSALCVLYEASANRPAACP